MKKQNVNNKLVFNKAAVTELNESSLKTVNGGAPEIITSSNNCSGCFCLPVTTRLTIVVAEM
ncbi:class I lanthipeptide [Flavobacterium amniphilum]|uniref:class I lanthipeptide n=1 Tax=Flavobacterium amniphilum TaxID=1834035 RepID=UPI00202A7555|nr:class I lanthipeptide [Flavobacterium amniphilum]MCL9807409.1 class I lanthipeptide [Flavobacterium amniphilum]